MKSSLLPFAAFLTLALGPFAVVGLGCHTGEPTSPPSPGLDKPINPPHTASQGRGANRFETDVHYKMFIAEGVASMCSGPSPSFTFDSAKGADNGPTMQNLANCMTTGPLKGKRIRLVGHTDPRGTEQYNDKLGLERAQRVKSYLVAQGIESDRIETTSHGEDDSSSDADKWPRDRHVQVELAQ